MPTYYAFTRHDTQGELVLVVPSGLAADIGSASVTFAVRTAQGATIVADGPATVGTVVTAADGSKGATFRAPKDTHVTGSAGIFYGQFTAIYPDGSRVTVPKFDDLWWSVVAAAADEAEAAASAVAQGDLQTQTAHGLAVRNLVRWNGSAWVKALADSDTTVAQAIVASVESTSQFRVIYLSGRQATFAAHGLGAGGTKLYLSQSVAGAITATRPTTYPIQQVGLVKDANNLILQAYPLEAL